MTEEIRIDRRSHWFTSLPVEQRFALSVVDRPTGCREWIGVRNRDGYGETKAGGRYMMAHRLAWELERGPIPEGLTIDHICRNPACTAIAHLRLMTHSDNCRRQLSAEATHCKWGHEFTDANTYRPPGTTRRCCRVCGVTRSRKYRERRDAA